MIIIPFLAIFDHSTEVYIIKTKLDSEGIKTLLMDEKSVNENSFFNNTIDGIKLLIHNNDLEEAILIYNQIRTYRKDENGNDIYCPSCNATQILIAPLKRKNIFYMLFPFFEKTRRICNNCKTVF